MKQRKNIPSILFLAVVALTVFGASFIMGKIIFSTYKTTVQAPPPENVPPPAVEVPGVAVAPRMDPPAEKKPLENAVQASAPATAAQPAPDDVEKVNRTGMKKNMLRLPVGKFGAPAAGAENPAAAAAQRGSPTAIAPAAPPATKPPPPAPKQKPAAQTAKILKKYKVIAASFPTEAGAETLLSRLRAENYRPTVVQADTAKGRFYRVIVGSHGSLSEAHVQMAELRKLGLQPFCILEQNGRNITKSEVSPLPAPPKEK